MVSSEKKIIKRRFFRSYVSSVISISLVLFLMGFFILIAMGANKISAYIKENVKLVVLLKDNVTDSIAEQTSKNIALLPQTKNVDIVSKEQGTKEMEKLLGEDFLSVFESNPIPISINVQLKQEYFYTDSIANFKRVLLADENVEEVVYHESGVKSMNSNFKTIGIVILFFMGLMLFISIVLINNTVRLNIFSKRFAIHTMQLVGATKGFVQKPFLYKSVYQGLLSSFLALIGLSGILFLVYRNFAEVIYSFNIQEFIIIAVGLVVVGVMICFISTLLIVRKMVGLHVNELYY